MTWLVVPRWVSPIFTWSVATPFLFDIWASQLSSANTIGSSLHGRVSTCVIAASVRHPIDEPDPTIASTCLTGDGYDDWLLDVCLDANGAVRFGDNVHIAKSFRHAQ